MVLFFIYNLAIKKTITAKKEYKVLLQAKKELDNATAEIDYLNKKKGDLDFFLKKHEISIYSSFQQILLQKITNFSKKDNIEIIAFNKPHIFRENSTIIETYSFEVKGNFVTLLKLINHIENTRLGELFSVHFEKKKNYRTRKEYLKTMVYIKKIKTI
ncbi:hypothetical protein [Tenacibaculum finnmarkense]|uniref:hypothetical protein n=1 Tax=Tenacibaculum finnmarkense TaxID=2781243 RepID=UPI001E50475A|nr:hypothetical protein [Tenacibaculum finnmarkense]MCD8413417.1 hypothetical protein [Tenacibaculum finnmarkense genomovar ulcerans]MCG8208150.1 hypothetical protein [Tenacibaculum finnmarkense genomovar finnmarkense]MCG8724140.1 hypothetical protein [Tenacibaculum finnmarkense]MCG8742485.1 hypothetical protein [Tenacibaculum finnmarkense]MCG8765920.1 hypothetical protein [Tenacibaculum finnmarkense]